MCMNVYVHVDIRRGLFALLYFFIFPLSIYTYIHTLAVPPPAAAVKETGWRQGICLGFRQISIQWAHCRCCIGLNRHN